MSRGVAIRIPALPVCPEAFRPPRQVGGCESGFKAEVVSMLDPRQIAERIVGQVMGNFTCGSSFRPGCYDRSNENLSGHRFMVIESDTLARDEVGAVFAYLRRRLHYELHCIIDTAGKPLHAWFEAPPNKVFEN